MTGAIALSLISLVLLIYFIHHVSASIQAAHIVRVIAEDLEGAIPRLYPSQTGNARPQQSAPDAWRGGPSVELRLKHSGYLESVSLDNLLKIATEQDVVIELLVKPGDHVVAGSAVAHLWGKELGGGEELPRKRMEKLRDSFLLARERTPAQDVRYQFQQLTDVVIRALSPGINDPFTAINGIDELVIATALLARRERVAKERTDDSGALRLIVPATGVGEVLEATVGHIAIYAANDPFVMAALRRVLDTVQPEVHGQEMATLMKLRWVLDRSERSQALP